MDEREPIWIIPARVKADVYLPLTATGAEIEEQAVSACASAVRLASDGGMEIVMPTAKVYVEHVFDRDEEEERIRVMAFAVCERKEPGNAGLQD